MPDLCVEAPQHDSVVHAPTRMTNNRNRQLPCAIPPVWHRSDGIPQSLHGKQQRRY